MTDLPDAIPALHRQYVQPSLNEVNLGFAGRRESQHRIHRTISELSPGDPLEVRIDKNSGIWNLHNRKGEAVGRLAQIFKPPNGMRCISAEVYAIVKWSTELSQLEYRSSMKCDSWEVVVPRLVFEPASKPE